MNKELSIKFGDFGLCSMLAPGDYSNINMKTASYLAPEIINSEDIFKKEQDVWALGCILYEIVTLNAAFTGKNMFEIMKNITEGNYSKEILEESTCALELKELIMNMLNIDYKKRPNINIFAGN